MEPKALGTLSKHSPTETHAHPSWQNLSRSQNRVPEGLNLPGYHQFHTQSCSWVHFAGEMWGLPDAQTTSPEDSPQSQGPLVCFCEYKSQREVVSDTPWAPVAPPLGYCWKKSPQKSPSRMAPSHLCSSVRMCRCVCMEARGQ